MTGDGSHTTNRDLAVVIVLAVTLVLIVGIISWAVTR